MMTTLMMTVMRMSPRITAQALYKKSAGRGGGGLNFLPSILSLIWLVLPLWSKGGWISWLGALSLWIS